MHCRPSRQSGFTLLEMMTAISVAAIVLALGIPNMRQFMWNSAMTSAANDLVIAITTARAEAVKSRTQTIMCFARSPNATTPACDGTSADGWIVFVDSNSNAGVDAGEQVLIRHDPLPAHITAKLNPSTNGRYRAFAPTGFPRSIGTLGNPITSVVLCDHRGNSSEYGETQSTARGITIGVTGRARVTRVVSEIADTTNPDLTLRLGGCT